ncbi:hypothetical protein MT325_m830R [Paramecium bursaria chlorella virus MT325]|uniref:Uncharacterized protein m830R n=1 Tax=Paramecium bursaria Chlorella virus MT325 TaxID=346932 RepID=A7IVL0_PBCVM|nr:hypothetical protein MT325_m830R [Paramecium bursaria chlorella virus MT325]
MLERHATVVILRTNVCTMFQKHPHDIWTPTPRCHMQWCATIIASRIHVNFMFKQHTGNVASSRMMQRGIAVTIFCAYVRTVSSQQASDTFVTRPI